MRFPEVPNAADMITAAAFTASGTQQFAGTKSRCSGAVERYGYLVIANNTTTILDDGMDWRDRLCDVRALAQASSTAEPGGVTDMTTSPPSPEATLSGAAASPFLASIQINQLWYSGLGWDAAAAVPNYAAQFIGIDTATGQATPRTIFLYADSVTGYLKIRNTDGGTRTLAIWIKASPALGGRSTIL